MTRTRVPADGLVPGSVVLPNDSRLTDARTPLAHTQAFSTITSTPTTLAGYGITDAASSTHVHGNMSNSGAIGTTANLPVITTTSGVLTTGSFGTAANTFCQGNDSRLSDARTPTSHTHGNISNAGAIGTTANLPIITTTSGVLSAGSFGTAANTFCQGNDSRLSDARTPTSHTHGNITNAGAIGSTTGQIVVTTTGGVLTTAASIAATSVTGLAASATTDTTNASNISAGTLAAARLPTTGVSGDSITTGTVAAARLASHTHTASQISDSTAAGRTLLTAADAAAQRTAIGVGTVALDIPLGSATAPGLDFTGDSNTGIFSPGADNISMSTNGVERFRIDGNGAMLSTPATYNSLSFHTACRHWVNFQGTANTNLTGTYSQSGTTVTVTATAHGLLVGQRVFLDFTTGTATDASVDVATVTNANTFTCTLTTSATTSGNVTLTRPTVRAALGVSSVSDLGVGIFAVNFSPSAPHANYAVIGSGSEKLGTGLGIHVGPINNGISTERVMVAAVTMADAVVDCDVMSVAIFY